MKKNEKKEIPKLILYYTYNPPALYISLTTRI